MFDCVSGLLNDDGISGCILADDMGYYAGSLHLVFSFSLLYNA